MIALLSPSMPIEMAPLRLTFAFSSTSTVASGRASFALIAATEPALPPPITSTSASSVRVSGAIMPTHLSSGTFQPQAVTDPVAPHVQMLVIDRHAGDVVAQAVDQEQRRARRYAELQRDVLLGGHRADLVIGGAQTHAADVFQEPENVPPHQVFAGEAPAEVLEPDHEPVALQLSERLPRRDAADRVLASELVLGREAIEWPVDAALDPFPKQIGQLLVQRSRSARGEPRAARLRRLVRLCHIKHAQPVEQPMCHSRLALLSVSRCSPQRGVPLT